MKVQRRFSGDPEEVVQKLSGGPEGPRSLEEG